MVGRGASFLGDVTLTIDNASLINEITNKLKTFMNKLHRRLGKKIERRIKAEVYTEIVSHPTYQELITPGSDLHGIVGVPDVEQRITNLINLFISLISVTSTVSNTNRRAGIKFSINLSRHDVQALLTNNDAVFTYSSKKRGGDVRLEWLRWLLLEGSRSIVRDYVLAFNSSRSRTRSFIMVEVPGGTVRIPGQHQGTISDNFFTQAVDRVDVGAIVQQFIQLEASKVN